MVTRQSVGWLRRQHQYLDQRRDEARRSSDIARLEALYARRKLEAAGFTLGQARDERIVSPRRHTAARHESFRILDGYTQPTRREQRRARRRVVQARQSIAQASRRKDRAHRAYIDRSEELAAAVDHSMRLTALYHEAEAQRAQAYAI